MAHAIKFLVVDEDATTESEVVNLLQGTGVHVDSAVNAVEAVSKAGEDNYDVIIAHRYLKPLDGAALIDRLRRAGCKSAFIYLVDQSEPGLAAEAIRLNVSGFLYKPLGGADDNARTLQKTVSAILRRRERAGRADLDQAEDSPSEMIRLSEVSTGLKTMREILKSGPASQTSIAQMVMVMIAAVSEDSAKKLEGMLPRNAIPRRANDQEPVAEQARRLLARVAMIESGFRGKRAFELANHLRAMHPELQIVVFGQQATADEIQAIGSLDGTMYLPDLDDPNLRSKIEALIGTLRKA
jgi:DNA-binding NarL/FixJ family response regulator